MDRDEVTKLIIDLDLNYCTGAALFWFLVNGKSEEIGRVERLEKAITFIQKEIQRLKDKEKQVTQKEVAKPSPPEREDAKKAWDQAKADWVRILGVPATNQGVAFPILDFTSTKDLPLEVTGPTPEKAESLPYCKECKNHFTVISKMGKTSYTVACPACNGGNFGAPKTEYCCECGKDYPAIDLVRDGHVFCGECRRKEEAKKVCPECKGKKSLSYYTHSGESYLILCPSCVGDDHPWKKNGWCKCTSSPPATPADANHYARCDKCNGLRKKGETCLECKGLKKLKVYDVLKEEYTINCPSCVEGNLYWKNNGWCRCTEYAPQINGDEEHHARCLKCNAIRKKVM